jgi:nucleoid-associated protein YgaU
VEDKTMGLFDFVKDAGEKLFGGGSSETADMAAAEAAARKNEQAITGFIQSLRLGVDDMRVQMNGNVAVIGGTVTSQEQREKVILAVGNIDGVAQVDDRLKVAVSEPEAAPEPEAVFYTVQSGDSLSKIAKAQYGNAMKYMVIFEANKPALTDPDKIYPGQVLRIPPLAE